jgi:hypothetical protein
VRQHENRTVSTGNSNIREGVNIMGKNFRDQNCWSRGEVSDARLHQHSGSQHAFGGWEKVSNGDGSFWMRATRR